MTEAIARWVSVLALAVAQPGSPLLPVVPIPAWSRLVLQRHRRSELVAGGALGLAASLLDFAS